MNVIIRNPTKKNTSLDGLRVLVVDDDPSIVRFLEILLSGQGFLMNSALCGEEGVETAFRILPDIILLDLALPDIDGAEVLRRLKDNDQTRLIPVIALTGRSEMADKVRSLDLGVDDYVTKPFDIRELKARVASVIHRRRDQRKNTEEEKLKTVREVIASVSHEVNNPLAAILMSSEAIERKHGHIPDVAEKCQLMQQNVLRIRDILKKLERVRVLASKPYVAGERILNLDQEETED